MLIFLCWCPVFNFIDFCSNFYSLFKFFFSFLRWKLRLLILDLCSFLVYVFSAMHFSLSSAFLASHSKLCFHFHFVQNIFKISLEISSLTHVLFRSVLSNPQLFWDFPAIILLLISSIIPLWFESRHRIISILSNLLRWVLWSRMWSQVSLRRMSVLLWLDEIANKCQLYPVDWWWYQLSSTKSSPVFCLLDLSPSDRGVLRSPTLVADSSVSPCNLSVFASHILTLSGLVQTH